MFVYKSSERNSLQLKTTRYLINQYSNQHEFFNKQAQLSAVPLCRSIKEIRCVFQFWLTFNAKTGYIEKTQATDQLRISLQCSNAKHDQHEFTCEILHYISTAHVTQFTCYLRQTVSISTDITTLTFLASYTTEFFFFWREQHVKQQLAYIHVNSTFSSRTTSTSRSIMVGVQISSLSIISNYQKKKKE